LSENIAKRSVEKQKRIGPADVYDGKDCYLTRVWFDKEGYPIK